MQLSELTLRLLFLFFPGIISVGVITNLTISKDKKSYYYFIMAFVYGTISYVILSIFKKDVQFLGCIFNKTLTLHINEIVYGSIIGFILGIITTIFITYEIFHRIARKFNITKKFDESTVWEHLFNNPDIAESWVTIRDKNEDLMYEGWVEFYSDDVKNNELFLRDVIVYVNSTGERCYKLDGMYLSKNSKDIKIEYRKIVDSKQMKKKERISKKNKKKGVQK